MNNINKKANTNKCKQKKHTFDMHTQINKKIYIEKETQAYTEKVIHIKQS